MTRLRSLGQADATIAGLDLLAAADVAVRVTAALTAVYVHRLADLALDTAAIRTGSPIHGSSFRTGCGASRCTASAGSPPSPAESTGRDK